MFLFLTKDVNLRNCSTTISQFGTAKFGIGTFVLGTRNYNI